MKDQKSKWTVVQHSGAGYGMKVGFARGLETRMIGASSVARVKEAGGVIFNTYGEAEEWAEAEMFPDGYGGLYPNAPGRFSITQVDGLKLYVPKER